MVDVQPVDYFMASSVLKFLINRHRSLKLNFLGIYDKSSTTVILYHRKDLYIAIVRSKTQSTCAIIAAAVGESE